MRTLRHYHQIGLLDELDSELRAQIARLEAQRELLAQVREAPGAAGPPLRHAAAFAGSAAHQGIPASVLRIEHEVSLLLALIGHDRGPELIERLLDAPAIRGPLNSVTARLAEVSETTPPAEVNELIADFLDVVPAVAERSDASFPVSSGLIEDYARQVLNRAQLAVVSRITGRLVAAPELRHDVREYCQG